MFPSFSEQLKPHGAMRVLPRSTCVSTQPPAALAGGTCAASDAARALTRDCRVAVHLCSRLASADRAIASRVGDFFTSSYKGSDCCLWTFPGEKAEVMEFMVDSICCVDMMDIFRLNRDLLLC